MEPERLRQWADRLADTEASAAFVLGVGLETGRVTVLSPEGIPACDIIRWRPYAANLVAVQAMMN